jgi:HSP20 family molecular chaperone IbpA
MAEGTRDHETQDGSKHETPQDVATVERTRGATSYSPRVDIVENGDELVLYVDLPGVEQEDLDLRFEHGELIIEGRVQPRHNEKRLVHAEYGIGDFYRTFSINEVIDSTKVSAEITGGVLTVHLPKTEAVKPRRIEVKSV